MATQEPPSQQHLRVHSYDKVSSWLISLLVVAIVTVTALVSIYFSRKLSKEDYSVPITPVESGGGGTGGMGPPGEGDDLEPPAVDDAPQLSEPEFTDTLSALNSAVATKTAIISDDQIDFGMEPVEGASRGDSRRPGMGGGRGGGVGGGIGSGFGRGRGGPTEPKREVRFEPDNLAHYAKYLDYFGIELGVLGEDNKVYYVYNLSQPKPSSRVGDPAQEQRLFMNPLDSQFEALDRQLAEKAGVADKGEFILQFYPPKTQALLFDLELKHAGGRTREQIRHTVFRVTPKADQFDLSVEEQSYR